MVVSCQEKNFYIVSIHNEGRGACLGQIHNKGNHWMSLEEQWLKGLLTGEYWSADVVVVAVVVVVGV